MARANEPKPLRRVAPIPDEEEADDAVPLAALATTGWAWLDDDPRCHQDEPLRQLEPDEPEEPRGAQPCCSAGAAPGVSGACRPPGSGGRQSRPGISM